MGLGHSRNLSNKAVHNTFAASSGPPGRTEPARPLLCPGWSGKAGFRTRRSANLSRKPRDGKLGFAVLARWLVVLVGLDRFRVLCARGDHRGVAWRGQDTVLPRTSNISGKPRVAAFSPLRTKRILYTPVAGRVANNKRRMAVWRGTTMVAHARGDGAVSSAAHTRAAQRGRTLPGARRALRLHQAPPRHRNVMEQGLLGALGPRGPARNPEEGPDRLVLQHRGGHDARALPSRLRALLSERDLHVPHAAVRAPARRHVLGGLPPRGLRAAVAAAVPVVARLLAAARHAAAAAAAAAATAEAAAAVAASHSP